MSNGITNKHTKAGWVTARFTETGNVALMHSDPLLGANAHANEIVTALNIISAEWSVADDTHFTISRGANTVLILTSGQHCMDFSDSRLIDTINGEPTSNVAVTLVGAGVGSLVLKLHKKTTISGGSSY